MSNRILIIDDEQLIRESLSHLLTGAGYQVDLAADGDQAKQLFTRHTYDLALIDLRLPDCSGIELLKIFKTAEPEQGPMCIMMTAYGSVDSAVQAMRHGAYDYINKPFKSKEILLIVKLALEAGRLKREVRQIIKTQAKKYNINNMIAVDPLMIKTFEVVKKVAANPDVSVLIQGESGTGKELIAKSLHYLSARAAKPFVSINCASIPGNLLESELFGYERGAFTDAKSRKHGLLEKAEGGTVFLDEIGDMSLSAQAKVLRALQENKITRVGGEKDIQVDVRVIAATNKNLKEEIEKEKFREDLYHRLSVILIHVPALRERADDIPILADHFMQQTCHNNGKPFLPFEEAAIKELQKMPWTGNIRELRNVVERLAILCDNKITADDVIRFAQPLMK